MILETKLYLPCEKGYVLRNMQKINYMDQKPYSLLIIWKAFDC